MYNESLIFVLNAVFAPVIWLIDPWTIVKRLYRDHEASKVSDCVLTQ